MLYEVTATLTVVLKSCEADRINLIGNFIAKQILLLLEKVSRFFAGRMRFTLVQSQCLHPTKSLQT